MLVAIPAALIGVLIAALSVYKKGLELEDDPEYQQRVADGLVKDFKKKVEGEKQVSKDFCCYLPGFYGSNCNMRYFPGTPSNI